MVINKPKLVKWSHEPWWSDSTKCDFVPLFMTQLKSDFTKETTGFSYQELDIYQKTENWSFV